jgi:hypothetical protein
MHGIEFKTGLQRNVDKSDRSKKETLRCDVLSNAKVRDVRVDAHHQSGVGGAGGDASIVAKPPRNSSKDAFTVGGESFKLNGRLTEGLRGTIGGAKIVMVVWWCWWDKPV